MKRTKRRHEITKHERKPKHIVRPKIKVTIVKKILGKTPEQYSFNLQDGRKLRTVYELIDELETMTDETFRQYATGMENHFANRIEHVFSEKELAEEIRQVHNRIDAQRAILKHLVRQLTKLTQK